MPQHNILVVEDEGIVALDIQGKLVSMGYQVPCIVSSAEEAISRLKAEDVPAKAGALTPAPPHGSPGLDCGHGGDPDIP